MATNKNITMKQFNGTDYDTLYPKTKVEQVEGAYTQQQILSDSTKGLFGFGTGAVPDDAFASLKNSINGISAESIGAAKIEAGSFIGTGQAGLVLTFGFTPKVVLVAASGLAAGSSKAPVFYCMLYGVTEFSVLLGSTAGGPFANGVAWSGNTATLSYSKNGGYYSNCSGVKYTYVAIG